MKITNSLGRERGTGRDSSPSIGRRGSRLGLTAAAAVMTGALLMMDTGTANAADRQVATLGGGCFWCLEAAFEMVPGVLSVTSGYAGGTAPNPTYKQVCTGSTGHAEVVQIEFDPAKISYEKLLDMFWEIHDPTSLNRQGADEGTQYRSIILYQSEAQRVAAEKSKAAGGARYSEPIVTEIRPLEKFYRAEEYHQHYFQKNPNAPYCRLVIAPKLKKVHVN